MLCVYPADCTDFSTNGLGTLSPTSAIVNETLNGSYELEVVHPYDSTGKWRRLKENRIIRAPVPSATTPRVALAYKATSEGKAIYRVNTQRNPLALRSSTGTKYKTLAKYKKGKQVIVIEQTTDSLYEVIGPDGKRGYMSASSLAFVRNESQYAGATHAVIESRQLRDQPFRIYRIVPELDKITVYARHIFYDLMDNMVKSFKPLDTTTGKVVVDRLSAACLEEHDFSFYSDLGTSAKDVELVNVNPVDCILGDGGIVENYSGELMRDWYDVFLVERVGNDTNIQIRQGKNLTGIKYDVDLTDVATRIMPTGQDKDGKMMYLPEVFVDSPLIDQYPNPKWIHLDVSEAKEVTKGKSSERKSKSKCYTEMRQAAQDAYAKGCDLPDITLTVDFIDVTQTEEYGQYAFLQSIFLGDSVRVIAKSIGIAVSMRMTEYSYDCLTRKYLKMTLGSASNTLEGNVITSRQLPSGIITGKMLALNSVGIGALQAGSVGELAIQEAAIGNVHIQSAAVGAANIQTAAIEFAHIAAATVNNLNAAAIDAGTAKIASLTASDIQTDSLAAALAAFTVVTCGTATFDAATIKHLVSQSMNLEYGAAGQVFIRNLAVEYAQMIGASIGNLCIKASNGSYYSIDVDTSGNVTGTPVTVTSAEIAAGQTSTGRVILETSITAADLNTSNLLATFALINHIDAARLDVDALFARQAFIDKLNTSFIEGNEFIEMTVGNKVADAIGAMKIGGTQILRGTHLQSVLSSNGEWNESHWRSASGGNGTRTPIIVSDAPNPNIRYGWQFSNSSTGSTEVSQDNIPVTFGQQYTISCYARCTQGTAVLRMAVWRSAAETYYRHITLNSSSDSSWKRYSLTYTHDFANSKAVTNVYFGENVSTGTLQICGMKFEMGSIPSDWSVCPEDVSDDIAQAQKAAGDAQFTADAARSALQRVVRIDNSGLHVGDNLSTGEVLIDSESVNVVMNGNRYSKFAGNYVQFGNYQLRRTVDGGLAFKMTDI